MADNPKERGPQDRARVNLEQDYEVQYWTEKWGVNEGQLRNAVREVGSSSAAVARQLGKGDPI